MTLPKIWTSEVLKSADLNGNFSYLDGFNSLVTTKTDSYVIPDGTSTLTVLMNASGKTVTLPSATTNAYRKITIKKVISANTTVTINTTSAQTIDGASSQTLDFVQEFMTVQSDGANWQIVNWYIPQYEYDLTVSGWNSSTYLEKGYVKKNRSGKWTIDLHLGGVFSGTSITISISDIIIDASPIGVHFQPFAAFGSAGSSAAIALWAISEPGTNQISFKFESTVSSAFLSGTAILNAKPSFVV